MTYNDAWFVVKACLVAFLAATIPATEAARILRLDSSWPVFLAVMSAVVVYALAGGVLLCIWIGRKVEAELR